MIFKINGHRLDVTIDTSKLNRCCLPSLRRDIEQVRNNLIGMPIRESTRAMLEAEAHRLTEQYRLQQPTYLDFAETLIPFLEKLDVL